MKVVFLALVIALVFATEFISPENGDTLLIERNNSIVFPADFYDPDDKIYVTTEYQNDLVMGIFEDAGMTRQGILDVQSSDCQSVGQFIDGPFGNYTLNLTLPVAELQDVLDAIDDSIGGDLPFDIPTARTIVNNILENVEVIPKEYRNFTVSIYTCDNYRVDFDNPDFESWVYIDSARVTMVGLLAVLAALLLLL
ncbi:hypothetical protein J8273_2435 [Carpediemonas membranifera]|uniref:Uncharacterized protein n=1 Tax=Carpediemonas membranifera TaxID=201153 RepID=A0A8J6E3L5_9EUKA|nr:hypothetical protein J8273_2435 [Carpediemonas membranifera]|eukprot:KAG9396083.1 hypothetical protein J8273_2435 [Carpediemonas membranifera]